jgi:hypothetical protein
MVSYGMLIQNHGKTLDPYEEKQVYKVHRVRRENPD